MTEIFQLIYNAASWIIMAVALGLVSLIGKFIFNAWKDIKTTLKTFAEAVNRFSLTIAEMSKDFDTLKEKVVNHSEKFKDQDRKFEEQDKRIDALEVGHAVIKTTCDLQHKKGGSNE